MTNYYWEVSCPYYNELMNFLTTRNVLHIRRYPHMRQRVPAGEVFHCKYV